MNMRSFLRRVIRSEHGLGGLREWSDLNRRIVKARREDDPDEVAHLRSKQRAMLPVLRHCYDDARGV